MEEYLGNKSNITNENGYYCYDTIQQFNRPIKFYDNDTLITHQKNVTSFDGEQYHIVLEKGFYDYCLKGNREALEELSENLIAMNSFKVNFKVFLFVFLIILVIFILGIKVLCYRPRRAIWLGVFLSSLKVSPYKRS